MSQIDLPRPIEAYFAFAELPANERGRHFCITLSYMAGSKLDRMQWWWHAGKADERAGEERLQALRREAIGRFTQHIEQWLGGRGQCLRGGEPFPQLTAAAQPAQAEMALDYIRRA